MSTQDPQDRGLMHPAFVRLVLVHMLFGLSVSVFLILPKHFAATLGAGATQIGFVMSMFGLANVLAGRPVRGLVGRIGKKRAAALGVVLTAVGGVGFALTSQAGVIAVIARLVQGLGWAMMFTAGNALAADLAPPGRMAQAIGVFTGAVIAMNAVGPVVAEALLVFLDHRMVWILGGLVAFTAFIPLRGIRDEREPPDDPRVPGSSAPVRLVPTLIYLWIMQGLLSATMATFHQPFALSRGIETVSVFWVGFTAGALLIRVGTGRLLDRVGHHRVAIASVLAYGGATVVLIFVGPVPLGLVGLVVGLAHGSIYPALMAMCLEQATPAMRSHLVVQVNVCSHTGALLMILLGLVAERVGYPVVFVLVAVASMLAGWLLFRLRTPPIQITQPTPV